MNHDVVRRLKKPETLKSYEFVREIDVFISELLRSRALKKRREFRRSYCHVLGVLMMHQERYVVTLQLMCDVRPLAHADLGGSGIWKALLPYDADIISRWIGSDSNNRQTLAYFILV